MVAGRLRQRGSHLVARQRVVRRSRGVVESEPVARPGLVVDRALGRAAVGPRAAPAGALGHAGGRPAELPTWKWLTGIVTLYGFLGQTRRALEAWLRRHETAIRAANFEERPSVQERTRYCDLGHAADIGAFVEAVRGRQPELRWITGVGGKGKSALAFEMARRASEGARRRLVPVLVDEDWSGSLSGYVASLLRVAERAPTPAMVETLGAAGRLLVIVDALSERGAADAEGSVAEAARRGAFSKMIVTSRQPCPEGASWRDFKRIEVRPLTRERLPDYVRTYDPRATSTRACPAPNRCCVMTNRRARCLPGSRSSRPLLTMRRWEGPLHLAMRYVEALRAARLDLSADDMLRASGIAAFQSLVREALAPREIEAQYLPGSVLASEADGAPFMDADAEEPWAHRRWWRCSEAGGLVCSQPDQSPAAVRVRSRGRAARGMAHRPESEGARDPGA